MPEVQRKGIPSLIKKVVIILLICLSFGSIGLSSFLDQQYYETRPRSPRPEEGRTHALYVHHGTLVYVTHVETLAYQFVPAFCLVFFAAGVYLHRRGRKAASDNRNSGTRT